MCHPSQVGQLPTAQAARERAQQALDARYQVVMRAERLGPALFIFNQATGHWCHLCWPSGPVCALWLVLQIGRWRGPDEPSGWYARLNG